MQPLCIKDPVNYIADLALEFNYSTAKLPSVNIACAELSTIESFQHFEVAQVSKVSVHKQNI